MDKVILSIDCGTQSLRTLLFSADGKLLDKAQVHYEPYFSEKPGWAEQHPEVYWKSLIEACAIQQKKHPDLFKKIEGIGVTTMRASMVNVDANGTPLRPVIVWLDQRKANDVLKLPFGVKTILKAIGMDKAFLRLKQDGKCNWIQENQPDIWKKTYKYLQISGFLNLRLTGEFVDSVASQIGHVPFNYKHMRWCKKFEPPALAFPIEKEKLPNIIAPGKTLGTVTEEASRQTGLPKGIPVIACGSDKGCETIGMGVLNEKTASLSFGTTATVQTTSKKYFEPIRFMPPYPAPIPGCYNPEIEIFRGYWMITWFKNEFAHKEVTLAEEKGITPEEELDNLLLESPPGAMGLIVQPYWGPGLKHPTAKGAMIGFGDVHKKAHVYRAVIEGLAYALLDGLDTIEKAGKTKVTKVAVSGGASQSDQICQISADIFDLPLVRGKTSETSGLGAAIITAVGLGMYPTFDEAIKHMVQYDTVFNPNPDHATIYNRLYKDVYQKIYGKLKGIYSEIQDITGYPEK